MATQIKPILEKMKSLFSGMSKLTKTIIGAVLTGLILLIVIYSVMQANRDYAVLFSNMTSSSQASAVSYLQNNGVTDFKVEGTSILVPAEQEHVLRAAMIQEGYPSSGFSYSTYYDNIGTMATESDRTTALQQDLQDRIAATIREFSGVHDAVVTIAMGEDNRYVLDSTNITQSSATVTVTMQDGQSLSDKQATAIRSLISAGVQNLSIENVVLTDTHGNSYNQGTTGVGSISEASELKLALEEQMNNKIRTAIIQGLGAFYGEENIRVGVNSTIDVNRKISQETSYPMPEYGLDDETDNSGIIGSEVWNTVVAGPDGNYIGGVVGADSNADIPTYPVDTDGDGVADTYGSVYVERDYKVGELTEQTEHLAGTLSDLTVTVQINGSVDNALTTEQLLNSIGVSANIPEELREQKIDLLIAPFYEREDTGDLAEGVQMWMIAALLGGLALFFIIMIVLLVLNKKKKEKLAAEAAEAAALAAAAEAEERERIHAETVVNPVEGADIMDVNTETSMQLRQDLRTFVGNNPEITATLIRNWMKGVDEGG